MERPFSSTYLVDRTTGHVKKTAMQFTYRDKTYTLPVMLKDITLAQWIKYKALLQKAREQEQEYEIQGLEECAFLSTFACIPIDEVKSSISLADVLAFAGTAMHTLMAEEATIQPLLSVEWNGKTFAVRPPVEDPATLDYPSFRQYRKLVDALHDFAFCGHHGELKRIIHSFLQAEGDLHPFVQQDYDPEDFFDSIADMPLDLAFGVVSFISDSAVAAGYLSRNPLAPES